MAGYDYPYSMDLITSYEATLSELEVIGPVAEGLRVNAYVTGGELLGPKLKGKIRPVGADWLTIRTDGVGILDVRATFELDDGAVIYCYYYGVGEMGLDGYQSFLDGKPPPPEGIELRTCPRFQTAHPDYLWLNRGLFVGVGKVFLDQSRVSYDIYQVK